MTDKQLAGRKEFQQNALIEHARNVPMIDQSGLFPEVRDVWNNCSTSPTLDICEVYVAARSHSLPTYSEQYETCKALGPEWELDPDQSGVRPSFVRCLRHKIVPKPK